VGRGLVCLVIVVWSLLGQTAAPTAAIEGRVFDSSRAAIPGALVTAVHEATGTQRKVTTGGDGRFSLTHLAPGEWSVKVAAAGFAEVEMEELNLSIGQTLRQQFDLAPAGAAERLEVRERADAVDAAAATAAVALGEERIEEAPARNRNYLGFVLLAPGAAPSAGASPQRSITGTRAAAADSGFSFAGMRGRNNALSIDGVDNRDETTGGNRVAIGLEMVHEFRVSATETGAELGGAAGGVLNVVTRSGENLLHGDVTFFAQNGRFNAAKPDVAILQRPRFRRVQPGVSLLGPLVRDRTFYAFAVEFEDESGEEFNPVQRDFYPTGARGTEAAWKLNHTISEHDAVAVRYAFSRGRVRNDAQGTENFADRSAQGSSLTEDHSLTGSHLHVFSPRFVQEWRAQFAERVQNFTPNGAGPLDDIPGVYATGTSPRLDADRKERHYQIVETLNAIAGRHRFSAGFDLHAVTLDASIRNRFAGVRVYPSFPAHKSGTPQMVIQAFGDPRTQMATLPFGAWAQYRAEVAPGLQVEAGMRIDRQRMPAGLPSSSNNIAPRAGIAWRPRTSGSLVLRAGAGLFFDRYPLLFLNEAVQKDGVRAWETINGMRSRYSVSRDFPSTYSRKFTFGAEKGIGKVATVTIEAMQVRGFHLPRMRNIAGTIPAHFLLEQTAKSDYAGVTIAFHRRMTGDFALLASYTRAATRDDASDFDEQPLDPFDLRKDWGRSRQHLPHRMAVSALYEWEGVTFAPIFSWNAGRPLNTLLPFDANGTGAYPLTARPAGVRRNSFTTRAQTNFDLRVMKTFPFHENRSRLQVGLEAFNVSNSPQSARFCSFVNCLGASLESLPGRQVQFLMQFEF
jgi:hypothetical protein